MPEQSIKIRNSYTVITDEERIDEIEAKIPAEASADNKLADKEYVEMLLEDKQDVIQDLAGIRDGAALGLTALQSETDPTVPNWAKEESKPNYTYTEVGADPAGSAASVQNNLDLVTAKIPLEATESNKLADKTFVLQEITGNVINNVTSTETAKSLSANQGKLLNDRINNIATRGRFLSLWNCQTGMPLTNPSGYPYEYHTGDFFIVNATGATNYIPNGSSYIGEASTTVYSGEIKVNDTIFYDGVNWMVFDTPGGNADVMDVYQNGESVVSGGIAYVTTPQALSALNEDSTHRLVTDLEKSSWNAKQAALVSGTNIKTVNGNSLLGNGNINVVPAVSSSDNGKFLRVVNGAWSAAEIPNASGVNF